jgi:hypothetical protein
MMIYCCKPFAQVCKLNAKYEERTSRVFLDWNMVNHPAKTTYVLLKSTDAKTWTEVVTDMIFRNYANDDIFDYDDRVNRDQKYYYRLKIIDANNRAIAFSNTVTLASVADKTTWVIYPNPVNDILNLTCQGNNIIGGVINVTVQDMTGKVLIRFRAASNNRKLEIPVSQLYKGMYIVQIFILNEMMMNEKFVKQ